MVEAVIFVLGGRMVWVFQLLVWTKLGKGDFKLRWTESSQNLDTDLFSSLTASHGIERRREYKERRGRLSLSLLFLGPVTKTKTRH